MAKHEQNRAARIYHAVVAILILLAGAALLGVGIWLQVTDNGGPLNLEYVGDNFFNFVFHIGVGSIVIGSFLMVTAAVSLLALSRKCLGVTFRIIYVLLALIIAAALVFICVVSSLIKHRGDSEDVRDFVFEAWERTVDDQPNEICSIEKNLECRGFSDSDCANCVTGLESNCLNKNVCANCGIQRDASVGCYTKIKESLDHIFLPMAIVSALLAAFVVIDILVVCCL